MYELTEERISFIQEQYEVTKKDVYMIEKELAPFNNLFVDEEDFYETVCVVAAQHSTIIDEYNLAQTKEQKIQCYMSIEEIVEKELNRKFVNNDYALEEIKSTNSIRHI